MAFSYAISDSQPIGRNRIVFGTYANSGGSTGGDIKTGLNIVGSVILTPLASSISANAPVCNETLPLNKGDVTIVTSANENGSFVIVGK